MTAAAQNCEKSAVKHFMKNPVLLHFVDLYTIFRPKLWHYLSGKEISDFLVLTLNECPRKNIVQQFNVFFTLVQDNNYSPADFVQ